MAFFSNPGKPIEEMTEREMLIKLLGEVDEIKRYVANTYQKTDSEVGDTQTIVRKIEAQLQQTDRQVDRIEQFERSLREIQDYVRRIERKIQ